MESIRFNAPAQPSLRPEVLNHKSDSPFNKNNIEFHIGADYLTDFSNKGIEDFISAHQPSGKELSLEEVKTFLQRVASNAETAKNISFDLADPQLGLFTEDGIATRHLEGAFTLNVSDRAALPAGQAGHIRFVDVTSASYDKKEQETVISGYQREIKTAQTRLKEVRDKHSDAKAERVTTLEIVGPGAEDRLKLIHERKQQIKSDLAQLETDKSAYEEELKKPDISSSRKKELSYILAGLPQEKEKLKAQNTQLDQQLGANQGTLRRRNLNDLDKLNKDLASQQKEIESLEGQIKTNLDKIRAIVKPNNGTPPASDKAVTPADKPAATETPAETEVKPDEKVTVGPGLDLAELRKQPANHQATRISNLPLEQQKAVIAEFSAEERQQIQAAADGYIANLSTTQSPRLQKQLEAYKVLQQSIKDAPAPKPANPTTGTAEKPAEQPVTPTQTEQVVTPTSADKPAQQPAKPDPGSQTGDGPGQPVAEQPATVQTAAQPAAKPTSSNGISVGESQENLPAGTLTSSGKPILKNGKPLTTSDFQSLSIEAKFDVLMDCDEVYLRDLLKSMGPQRAQIKVMAQKVVADIMSVQQNKAPSTIVGGVTGTVAVNYVAAPMNNRQARAELIIRIIDELDGNAPVSNPSTPASTTAGTVRTLTAGAGETIYTVKPGDTANKLAKQEMGNDLYNYDIFDRNPGLEAAMKARHNGQQFNLYDEDISSYKEFQQLLLSRTPKNPSPVNRSEVRKPDPQHPGVTSEPVKPEVVAKPAAQTPVQPAVQTPVKPAAQTTAKVEVQEPVKPAAQTPAKTEKPPEKPAEKPPETAKLVDETPAQPTAPVTATADKPADKPVTATVDKPADKPVVTTETPVQPVAAKNDKPAQTVTAPVTPANQPKRKTE